MLDITTLAAWGEFVGGIAVVVSLIYLAAQIRMNTKTVRASNYSDLLNLAGDFSRMLADQVGNLWVQAYPPPARLNMHWSYYGAEFAGGDWVVLSPSGNEITRVRMPDGLRVLEIGEDYVLGTVHEDINVDAVRLYALRKVG